MSTSTFYNVLSCNHALVLAGSLLSACASSGPPAVEKSISFKLAQPQSSGLVQSIENLEHVHPKQSGHVVLNTGREAFISRIVLAASAQSTLDTQYYIWNSDSTGRILVHRLVAAADRGVRVRLLVDDFGVGSKDNQLIALDAHERIEVRVYNPFNEGFRSGLRKSMEFVFGFSRLNRRMHSKTFIVDSSVAITGGRNIGDEYFDANPTMNLRDRDMLSIGPVVDEISNEFDVMWNSAWAIPISAITSHTYTEDALAERYQQLQESVEADLHKLYPLPNSPQQEQQILQTYLDESIWAPTRFVYNPPAITAGDDQEGALVGEALVGLLSAAKSEVLVESAYFTIMDDMFSQLVPYMESGLDIKVLTNSLSSTDVWSIHAGYTRNREKLLKSGVEMHEWRKDGQSCAELIDNDKLDCAKFTYSLHAKTVVFDTDTVFVGSFNLNPRSNLINTETALIIQSSEIAQRIAADIRLNMQPENSWKLGFSGNGALRWHGTTKGVAEVLDHEPQTGFWLRTKVGVVAKIPLEKYW